MSSSLPIVLRASQRLATPPAWAVAERALLDRLGEVVKPYLAKYLRPDHTLIYGDRWVQGRDGLDDLYEAFYNFPLAYLLGASAELLKLGHRQWEAMTRQGAGFGLVHHEYEVGYDQFHQSEGNLLFYYLCAADPGNARLRDRARRFADLYVRPDAGNYDPEHNIIRAVHNGALGPRWGYLADDQVWSKGMARYGLPLTDLPGIESYDDIAGWYGDPQRAANADRMNAAINERFGRGDSAANLPVTSLSANAYLLTGDTAYRDWTLHYAEGWWQRAAANDGLLPDNVGLDGEVGAYFGGRWYGAAYGWSWPHGYDSVVDAAAVAAGNAALLASQTDWLDLPNALFDRLFAMGRHDDDYRALAPSIVDPWIAAGAQATGSYRAYVMPKRFRDGVWFDEQPVGIANPFASWALRFSDSDRVRLDRVEAAEECDWRRSFAFHAKGDDGHERPWLAYLDGRNPDYPETILRQSEETMDARLALIRDDQADLTKVHIHHWQDRNPITTEALIQLTLGAPQPRYNGGLLQTALRYFDPDAARPGLPADVAALVSRVGATFVDVTLVNTGSRTDRRVLLQAGFFGEHRFTSVRLEGRETRGDFSERYLVLDLPAGAIATLALGLDRRVATPSYDLPDYARFSAPPQLSGTP